MQFGLGLNNLTIPSFLIKILTGHTHLGILVHPSLPSPSYLVTIDL